MVVTWFALFEFDHIVERGDTENFNYIVFERVFRISAHDFRAFVARDVEAGELNGVGDETVGLYDVEKLAVLFFDVFRELFVAHR